MRTLVRLAPAVALATALAGPVAAQQPSPSAQPSVSGQPSYTSPSQTQPHQTQQPSAWPSQQGGQPSLQQPQAAPSRPGFTIASDSLIGTKVFDQQGKQVGEISKLMIDAQQGKVAAAVVKQGGALGMGAREISVPWEALNLQRGQNQELIVSMQQQFLEQAPSASPRGQDGEQRDRMQDRQQERQQQQDRKQ
jgi:hypothetical protein